MPEHFIREWRKHRRMTMSEFSELLGVSMSVVSRLERGEQRYNQDILEKAAKALICKPEDLISRDPAVPSLVDMIRELPVDKRETVEALVLGFRSQRK